MIGAQLVALPDPYLAFNLSMAGFSVGFSLILASRLEHKGGRGLLSANAACAAGWAMWELATHTYGYPWTVRVPFLAVPCIGAGMGALFAFLIVRCSEGKPPPDRIDLVLKMV